MNRRARLLIGVRTEQQTKRITPNPSTVDRDETEFHTEKLKVEMLSIGVDYRFDL
jgi:hypothetical protein